MVCLIFTPETQGPGAEGGHIRQAMSAYVATVRMLHTLLARDYYRAIVASYGF